MNSLPVWPTSSVELGHEFRFALSVTEHHQCAAAWLQHAHQSIVTLTTQFMHSQLRLDGHFASRVNKCEVGLGYTFFLQPPATQTLRKHFKAVLLYIQVLNWD